MLGVWPGGRGVGGDDVVGRRVARAVALAAGVGVLEVDVVGEVAGDGDCLGVGTVEPCLRVVLDGLLGARGSLAEVLSEAASSGG